MKTNTIQIRRALYNDVETGLVRGFAAFVALLIIMLAAPSVAYADDYFGMDCPGHWGAGAGGQVCVCPDGSYANMIGGQVVCPSAAPQYQPQPESQPVVGCGSWNCPLGTTCSQVKANACISAGFSECPNGGTCGPGLKCTIDGQHCMPAANSECGNHSCSPGSYCGSRNVCMTQGTNDCGNGSWCGQDKRCSRDGKLCLEKDTFDCSGHACPAGTKCGGGNTCLPIDSADCGNGTSCPADSLCKKGGGCITRTELTQKQADDKARQEAAAAEKKAAEQKRIDDAKEAARLKEEERQHLIAQQKTDAVAKLAEQNRIKEEARLAAAKKLADDRAAALAEAQRKRDEAAKALAEQQELARIRAETTKLQGQADKLKSQQAPATQPAPVQPSKAATAVTPAPTPSKTGLQLNSDLKDVSTLKPSPTPTAKAVAPGPTETNVCSTFKTNDPNLDKYGCPKVVSQPAPTPTPTPTPTGASPFGPLTPEQQAAAEADAKKKAADPMLVIGRINYDSHQVEDCGGAFGFLTNSRVCQKQDGIGPGRACTVCTASNLCDLHQNGTHDNCTPVKDSCSDICK